AAHAGIGDQHIHRAERLLDAGHEDLRRVHLAQVGADRNRSLPGAGDPADDLAGRRRVRPVGDGDRRARRGEPARQRPPDAAAPAGDEGDAAFQGMLSPHTTLPRSAPGPSLLRGGRASGAISASRLAAPRATHAASSYSTTASSLASPPWSASSGSACRAEASYPMEIEANFSPGMSSKS